MENHCSPVHILFSSDLHEHIKVSTLEENLTIDTLVSQSHGELFCIKFFSAELHC